MSLRNAVLIGVPKNKKEPHLDLPVVYNDMSALHTALEASNYSVKSYGIDDPSEVSANLIEDIIDEACKSAPSGSTLLFYFSGHGIHFNGKDLLVPWDGQLNDPSRIEKSLVNTDISTFVERSSASVVVFFVDACREGVQWEFKTTSWQSWGRSERGLAERRAFILVYSCKPGELSQYTGGPDGFSLFSKALSQVLAPSHPAESIDEVVRATQTELNRLIKETRKNEQHIRIAGEQDLDAKFLSHKIADGQPVEGSAHGFDANWVQAAKGSRLWRKVKFSDDACRLRIIETVENLVASCESEWARASTELSEDPWRDHTYPLRVLSCLEMLVSSLPLLEFSPAEASILISTPFVREAIHSCGVCRMASANPLNLVARPNQPSSLIRRRLEITYSAHPQMIRKASRASERTAHDAIATWLMHRCIVRDPNTWQVEPEGYIPSTLSLDLRLMQNDGNDVIMTGKQMIDFAQCVGGDPARIERADRSYALRERVLVAAGQHEQHIREQLLGYLLCIAGWMGLDLRMMADILPDHIGTADPISVESIHNTLRYSYWRAVGKSRSIHSICEHPAIDYAIRDVALRANDVIAEIHRRVANRASSLKDLIDLPIRLGVEFIQPEIVDGNPVYETPHLNFHLAQDEVRELLMGEQLYDEPELALRELYQNALDACRYRRARLQYLERTGRIDESMKGWEGLIEFSQGTDPIKGRFIECRDNGIGMGRRELENCFAKAGKRFCDLPEFIEEQNEWMRCDPPIRMYPNSQFGVGVFSYFMLADELEIETCRLDRRGLPGKKLLITVPGSGSLFRVQELGPGKQAGTRVRLYLRATEKLNKLSCVRSLVHLLWVAEFKTGARHGWRRAEWEPGKLRHPHVRRRHQFPRNSESSIWWTTEPGQVLADGITVTSANTKAILSTGIVLNLTGERKPSLTVDRRKTRDMDLRWIRDIASKSIECLRGWNQLSFFWLWNLLSVFPELEKPLNQILSDTEIPLEGRVNGSKESVYYRGSLLHEIEARIHNKRRYEYTPKLEIASSGNVRLTASQIGINNTRVSQVGLRFRDVLLWRLVWESWNWEFEKRQYSERKRQYRTWGFDFPNLYSLGNALGFDRKNPLHSREDFVLDGRLKLRKWFKMIRVDGLGRLRAWRRVGLVLPEWLLEMLGDLETKGLSDHYLFNHFPKSRVARRRFRDKARRLILRTRYQEHHPIRTLGFVLVFLVFIYFVVVLGILLTRKAFQ